MKSTANYKVYVLCLQVKNGIVDPYDESVAMVWTRAC